MVVKCAMSEGPPTKISAVSGLGGGIYESTCCAVINPKGPTQPGRSYRNIRLQLSFCCSASVLNSSKNKKF